MYQRTFSRANPGCIVFLLDRSDSMKRNWQGSGTTLAHGAAHALNTILLDLCVKATKEVGGAARHYFDVGVFGYGASPVRGGEGVESALGGALAGQALVPIPQLFDNPLAVRDQPSVDAMPGTARIPVWVEPVFGYRTPMCQAIAEAGDHVWNWASAHQNSFPPIVINITDGWVTDSPYQDADLAEWARRLTSIETNDGPALLLNIFLSDNPDSEVLFPTGADALPDPGPRLFAMSSPLPEPMVANARASRIPIAPGARGLVFNAGLSTLVKFLEIGTRVTEIDAR
jgi:hypothetical protein